MTAIKKIEQLPPLPNFNLPSPYDADYWDFKNWDYYKNSSEKYKKEWNLRGNTYKDGIDFTDCQNKWIREEIKFFLFTSMTVNNNNLYTFSNHYDKLKPLIRFINAELSGYYSLTEIQDLSAYEVFLSEKQGIALKNELTNYINANLEKTTVHLTSPFIRILKRIIALVNDFYDDRNEIEKDIWNVDNLPYNIRNSATAPIRTLNFTKITQPQIKEAAKEYVKLRLNNLSIITIVSTLLSINDISGWLETYHPEITNLAQLNRDLIEEYIGWINVYSGKNSKNSARSLGYLNTVLDWLRLANSKLAPSVKIIGKGDYQTKVKYEPKPYSDEEMKTINKHLDDLDDEQHIRIIILLQIVGCRLYEILELKPEHLIKKRKNYSLQINSTKNKNIHNIPISSDIAEIIIQAINVSKERYGNDIKYVFATDSNNHINYSELRTSIKKMAFKNNLKDDTGRPFNITIQRFRTTLSCKLLELGIDANLISLLLGHKVTGTIKHYAKLSEKDLKEAMKPRLDKFDFLIKNIGKVNGVAPIISDEQKLIPLPNGYCSKAPITGICEHANSCLTCNMFQADSKYLLGYKLQLQEVQKAIDLAKDNERIIEFNTKLKETLTDIISKLEDTSNEEKQM